MKLLSIFKKRINFFLKSLFVISFFFILYQSLIFMQLVKTQNHSLNLIRGTHEYQQAMYKADEKGQFTCITSFEKIDFSYVNDDYCDCLDGSDEPANNACPNGQFFCRSQADVPNFKKIVSSSKVNDGICDCCDGSDEWLGKVLNFALPKHTQEKLGRYFAPCPIIC
ncbi:glucosidase 2 subunit beta [Agrilus planipennis]|uniref:Glucosidase 2 subunit beta n=1 Tax=Agrilus planipennis TaxID=224129 RepID=A0A1W4WX04_AGRPL|nr:glucosidase 2 subunit beta [Agrilus planipennis]